MTKLRQYGGRHIEIMIRKIEKTDKSLKNKRRD
jgi:hypothetical protein